MKLHWLNIFQISCPCFPQSIPSRLDRYQLSLPQWLLLVQPDPLDITGADHFYLERMDQLMAIQMGVDDYITKPIDLQLTAAKIQASLRRTYNFQAQRKKSRWNLPALPCSFMLEPSIHIIRWWVDLKPSMQMWSAAFFQSLRFCKSLSNATVIMSDEAR